MTPGYTHGSRHVGGQGGGGRLYISAALLVVILVVGTSGYTWLEGWPLLDSLYMVIITISTVGYGEVRPLTTGGRMLTMGLILGGIGTAAYTFTLLAQLMVESRLFVRRKMEREIADMSGHYIVCGFGRMGSRVTDELRASGLDVVIVEKDNKLCENIRQAGEHVLEGDATDDEVLQAAGISRARGLATTLDSDANNLYVVLTARELNKEMSIAAYSHDDRANHRLARAGATRVICPFDHAGFQMATALTKPAVLDFIDVISKTQLDLTLSEVVIRTGSDLDGTMLRDTTMRADLGVIIVAIKRMDGKLVYNPSSDEELGARDVLVVLGPPSSLPEMKKMSGRPKK